MKWCGTFAGSPTWAHGTFSPCLSETITSAILSVLGALVLGSQLRKLRILRQRNYLGQQQLTAAGIVSAVGFAILVLSHTVSLILAAVWLSAKGDGAPYNIFYEASLSLLWTAPLVRCTQAVH